MAEVRWERLTAPELRALAARDAVVVLPVASLEQHGPHLPVWTDSFIGHAVAIRGAELADDLPAVVLPPMWMGLSEHHFPFGGTVSLDYATFAAVLRCVTRSIMADGFRKLFLLNSHGGNIEPLAVSARELAHEFGIPVVTTTITKLAPQAVTAALTTQSGIQHACEGETSLWLHLDPSQVRADQVAHSVSPGGFAAGDAAATRFWSFAERAPVTGVRGDPRGATAEKGRAIFEGMAAGLAAMLRDVAIWQAPDAVWRAGRAQAGQG
ncbi:creatininase [Falsiroseomonas bella]|uniref:Creatininase n=1 Tax=Falsiroseomonas bella TaxID=2184016 RepID=A0A317FEP4_9PROT|nr:creatininase family protein [Falsiroseomonas bella]PWS37574.1 creatininase [Falsiroseomonas bella]